MIRHIVLIKFRPDMSEDGISEIYEGLSAVTGKIPGAHGFTAGRSDSPEHMERGYMHAFVIDFDSRDALKAYADHPEHRALGGRIVENAVGGRDGLIVLDLDV